MTKLSDTLSFFWDNEDSGISLIIKFLTIILIRITNVYEFTNDTDSESLRIYKSVFAVLTHRFVNSFFLFVIRTLRKFVFYSLSVNVTILYP